jgi:hypothetical protein
MKALPKILEAGRVDPAGRMLEQRLEHATQANLEQTRASQQRQRALRDELATAAELAKATVELGKGADQLIPGNNRLDGRACKLLDLAVSGVGSLAASMESARLSGALVDSQLEASLEVRRRARRT